MKATIIKLLPWIIEETAYGARSRHVCGRPTMFFKSGTTIPYGEYWLLNNKAADILEFKQR
jgi:hypothetical protein